MGRFDPMAYELYSWQESNGAWDFCVLPSPSGVNVSAEQVFSKKCQLRSVKELKGKISVLSVGAEIYWMDRLSAGNGQAAKGSKRLRFPPSDTMQDIEHYAEAHKIKIEVLSDKNPR